MPDEPQSQISQQLAFIVETLQIYISETLFGAVEIASNVEYLWRQSAQDSQRPMLYVCYAGETPWSSNANISALTHRVSRDFIIRVKQGRGFASTRGDTVPQFTVIVEKIRDTIRSMLGISEDAGIDYGGIKPVRLGDKIIDCYDISFSCKNDLPTILATPDE